jgi:hypothetical protein
MNSYLIKGFTEDKATRLTNKIFSTGEDIEEAKEALKDLVEYEKVSFEEQKKQLAAQAEANKKAERQALESLNKIANDTKEIIPGIVVTPKLRSEVVRGLTQPVGYTEDNRPLDIISKYLYDNPVDGRFKLAYLLKITDDLKDLNKVTVKAKNTAVRDLAKVLSSKDLGLTGQVEFRETDNSVGKFDWDKYDLA